MGKLIVIEGTDCSGKETQSKLLFEKLKENGLKVVRLACPWYDSPTGIIVGACLLGKPEMTQKYLKTDSGFFKEGAGQLDSLTALCYFAADRRYNLPTLKKYLDNDYIVIIDRYTTSNMAHRGGMISDKEERLKMYHKIEELEYDILELPKPDKVILLYMPYQYSCILKEKREEALDECEKDEDYLKRGEMAYLELAKMYNYKIINCVQNGHIKSIENINKEIYAEIIKK